MRNVAWHAQSSILSIFDRHIGDLCVGYGLGEAVAEQTDGV